jgi:hypothetical protein
MYDIPDIRHDVRNIVHPYSAYWLEQKEMARMAIGRVYDKSYTGTMSGISDT